MVRDFFSNRTINFSLFRLFFGLMMIPQVLGLLPFIHELSNSTIVLHYPYLNWVEAYSHGLIDILGYTAILGAFLLAIGLLPRIGAVLFFVCFSYLFLIDISFYNNHYYLWCLISFLFIVVDLSNSINIKDVWKRNIINKEIAYSSILPFKLLITIVYFYAAIAKMNPDWIQGYPPKIWLNTEGFSNSELLGLMMAWLGLVFDLVISVGLWCRPTKWYVVLPYFAFHTANMFLFNIGMFPPVMMAAWLLFLPPIAIGSVVEIIKNGVYTGMQKYVLFLFFIFQILFPLRFLFMENKISWHRQGYYFAWRMMLDNYHVKDFQYKVVTKNPNNEYFVQFDKFITYRQFQNTYNEPYSIWLIAQKLKRDAITKYKTKDVSVYCRSIIELNQHKAKSLTIDTVDIGKTEYKIFRKNNFVTTF